MYQKKRKYTHITHVTSEGYSDDENENNYSQVPS